jgi:hypothetical protein
MRGLEGRANDGKSLRTIRSLIDKVLGLLIMVRRCYYYRSEMSNSKTRKGEKEEAYVNANPIRLLAVSRTCIKVI